MANTQGLDLSDGTTWRQWNGGRGTLFVSSTAWGGGSVKLQASIDGGATALDLGASLNFTANGAASFELAACMLKVAITTATGVVAKVGGVLQTN
jgi:hypothetical protein